MPACFCMHVCVCVSVCVCVKHPTVGLRGMELDKKLPSDTDFPNRLITLDCRVAPRLSDVCKMTTHIFWRGVERTSRRRYFESSAARLSLGSHSSLSCQSQRMALYLLSAHLYSDGVTSKQVATVPPGNPPLKKNKTHLVGSLK